MYEDIKELKKLADDGIITQEEFEKKKYEILGMESPEDRALRDEIEQARAEERRKDAEEKAQRKAARKEALRNNKKRIISVAALILVAIAAVAVVYNVAVPKTAFAVYSADDHSLTFYKDGHVPEEGDRYKGKECTAVYEDVEETLYDFDIFDEECPSNPEWYNDGRYEDVETVSFNSVIKPKSCAGWFARMSDCTRIDMVKLDTSEATDLSSMFFNCESLESLDVSHMRTSNVESFYRMFGRLNVEELDVSGFDTSSATSFRWMFEDCSNLEELDVSGFDTSKATTLCGMFGGCSALKSLDVSGFDTSNAEDLSWMFDDCYKLENLNGAESWDVSACSDFENMFYNCGYLKLDCSDWSPIEADTEDFDLRAPYITAPDWES